MKKLLMGSLAAILLCSGPSFATTFFQQQDTLKKKESVQITPNYYPNKIKSLGTFGVVTRDSLAFQTYAGWNVVNTLRGHVPNLNIGNDPTTFSSPGSLMVIDGVPFSNDVTGYYNFNAFEYQNIYAFNSGNASTLYGAAGGNGAFFLESKNGKNFTKPSVEFNSSASVIWNEYTTVASFPGLPSSEEETLTQWRFSNSVAYMQDFGKVDTRVSYSYTALPDDNYGTNSKTNFHYLRINTGYDITPKLSARLILDNVFGKNTTGKFYFPNGLNGQPIEYQAESLNRNLQGNLTLKYDPLRWLTLSSQTIIGKISSNSLTELASFSDSYSDQQRSIFNFFATVHKSITSKLSFNTFIGIQTLNQKLETEAYTNDMLMGSATRESSTDAAMGGIGVEYKNVLFGNFNYRVDQTSMLPSGDNRRPYYSYSTSFVFSEAFKMQNSWFSSGKIRGSYGKISLFDSGYPYTAESPNTPSLQRASWKTIFESGVDLSFLNKRVLFTTSYFMDKYDQTLVDVGIPGTGYGHVWVDLGALKTSGWEVILGGTSVQREGLSLNTKLIWTSYKTTLESGDESAPIEGSLPKTGADWYGSVLNQLNWKNFFTTFLVSIRNGGYYFTYDRGFPPSYTSIGASEARLRDISIGYRISPALLNRLHIKTAQISLSGRNLWLIYAEDDRLKENTSYNSRKSANISLTLSF